MHIPTAALQVALVRPVLLGVIGWMAVLAPAAAVTAPEYTPQTTVRPWVTSRRGLAPLLRDTTPDRPMTRRELRVLELEIARLERLERQDRLGAGHSGRSDDPEALDDLGYSEEGTRAARHAVAGFVTSLGGMVLLSTLGLPAYIVGVVFSARALKRMRALNTRRRRGLAIAGLVIGIVGIAGSVLFLALWLSSGV